MWIRSLSQENTLEQEMETRASVLAWEIHGQKSLVGYSSRGCKRVGHNVATKPPPRILHTREGEVTSSSVTSPAGTGHAAITTVTLHHNALSTRASPSTETSSVSKGFHIFSVWYEARHVKAQQRF